MGTVTYPQPQVIDFIQSHFIPIKIDISKDANRFDEFKVQWTPTIIILDQEENEHHRITGYFSPEDFLSELRLGLANLEYHQKHYNEAMREFRQVLQVFPNTSAAPEALYFAGVCNYMATHEPSHLKETYTELKEKYPSSDWTKKAEVWS